MRPALWWRWWVAAAVASCLLAARPAGAAWCIARSGASEKSLQTALDYACGPAGGADCAPIQASGLCYLPNTVAAHASYAFNSVFQRARAAPGACDFSGIATITLTDPRSNRRLRRTNVSAPTAKPRGGRAPTCPTVTGFGGYGSCTYPASPSTAGQSGSPGSTSGIPSPPDSGGGGGLSPPDLGPGDDSGAVTAAAAEFFLPLAVSCLVYLLLHT